MNMQYRRSEVAGRFISPWEQSFTHTHMVLTWFRSSYICLGSCFKVCDTSLIVMALFPLPKVVGTLQKIQSVCIFQGYSFVALRSTLVPTVPYFRFDRFTICNVLAIYANLLCKFNIAFEYIISSSFEKRLTFRIFNSVKVVNRVSGNCTLFFSLQIQLSQLSVSFFSKEKDKTNIVAKKSSTN